MPHVFGASKAISGPKLHEKAVLFRYSVLAGNKKPMSMPIIGRDLNQNCAKSVLLHHKCVTF